MSSVCLRRLSNTVNLRNIVPRKWMVLSSLANKENHFGYGHVRHFFGGSSTQEYSETKVLGYSMEQFYDVVANVDDYKEFVPWCVASNTFQKSDTFARANLEIGFPPVSEKYTSVLTLVKPNFVKSECMDGSLFNHLECVWKFSKGPNDIPNSCTLNFYVSFEFKSILHSQLSSLFFDEVVRKMVSAFEDRCHTLYGPSSLINTRHDPNKRKYNLQQRRQNPRAKTKPSPKMKPEGS